jgi:hypothetical protein
MDVRIDEVHSTVDAVGGEGLLTPEVLQGIVGAVLRALELRGSGARTLASEREVRSVLDQQRGMGADRG